MNNIEYQAPLKWSGIASRGPKGEEKQAATSLRYNNQNPPLDFEDPSSELEALPPSYPLHHALPVVQSDTIVAAHTASAYRKESLKEVKDKYQVLT